MSHPSDANVNSVSFLIFLNYLPNPQAKQLNIWGATWHQTSLQCTSKGNISIPYFWNCEI